MLWTRLMLACHAQPQALICADMPRSPTGTDAGADVFEAASGHDGGEGKDTAPQGTQQSQQQQFAAGLIALLDGKSSRFDNRYV